MSLLRDLIPIPEHVGGEDFVLKLVDAITDENAERTLDPAQYVITPTLATRFVEALDLVEAALGLSKGSDGRLIQHAPKQGVAAYLHGSFGSGKSHFMAVLLLLLRGHLKAKSRTELAPALARHGQWLGTKRFLLVACHMLNAESIEHQVFTAYVDAIRAAHPEATPAPLFNADEIIENADRLRGQLGDEQFFALINGDAGARAAGTARAPGSGNDGWGTLGEAWTAERFEAAARASVVDPQRAALAAALTTTVLSGLEKVRASTVPFEAGLKLMTEQAKTLGYDGLCLFLDELVLWLAQRASDEARIGIEVEKLVKLVEAQQLQRPIPVVAFIARQRDLRTLIGSATTGAERTAVEEKLSYHEGRFRTITLESSDLPEIAAQRLLRPVDDRARGEIDRAFQTVVAGKGQVVDELLGSGHTRDEFRKLYPFSPVLVDALVATSALLQRDRTALRAMLQLLVRRRESLAVGEIIPVGDLYDVISDGRDAISTEYSDRFHRSRRLFDEKLLPLLEQTHGVAATEIAALPWDDPRRAQWRADERILKTLLVGALAQGVVTLQHLTPARIAALNHGTVRSPIPGGEATAVLDRCKRWATQVPELQITGDSANPTIRLEMATVDVESIVRNVQTHDNDANRRKHFLELLRGDLGLATDQSSIDVLWHGVERPIHVQFCNLEELGASSLRHDQSDWNAGWKLVIDRPFSSRVEAELVGLQLLADFSRVQSPTPTVVWAPRRLSEETLRALGRYVTLRELLQSEHRFEDVAKHLSHEDRAQARSLLMGQRDTLRTKLEGIMRAAYGLASAPDALAGLTGDGAEHVFFHSLDPNFTPRPPASGSMRQGAEAIGAQAFEQQYPAAPQWPRKLANADINRVLKIAIEAAGSANQRVECADAGERRLCQDIAVPLELANVQSAFVLTSYWRDHFNRVVAEQGSQRITVAALRRSTDAPKQRGLPPAVRDLLILVYAEQDARVFLRDGLPITPPTIGGLRDSDELDRRPLPSRSEWNEATDRIAKIFGETGFLAPTMRYVEELSRRVHRLVESAGDGPRQLRDRLRQLGAQWSAPGTAAGTVPNSLTNRVADAENVVDLMAAIASRRDTDLVRAIANHTVVAPSTFESIGASFKQTSPVLDALTRANWTILDGLEPAVAAGGVHSADAAQLRDQLRDALAASQLAERLDQRLPAIERAASALANRLMTGSSQRVTAAAASSRSGDGAGSKGATGSSTPTLAVDPLPDVAAGRGQSRVVRSKAELEDVQRALADAMRSARRPLRIWWHEEPDS